MTIICALKDVQNKKIWIGSDQQMSFGNSSTYIGSKWIIDGNWAIGVSGKVRGMNIIANQWPKIVTKHSTIHDIVNAIREAFREHGFKEGDEKGFPGYNHQMLITDSLTIWDIGSELSYCEIQHEMATGGSGWDTARTAYHTLMRIAPQTAAEQLLQLAIEITNFLDSSCGKGVWKKALPFPETKDPLQEDSKHWVKDWLSVLPA